MQHTKFQDIGQLGLEKKIFDIHGHCGHLGHVTQLIHINFHPPSQERR